MTTEASIAAAAHQIASAAFSDAFARVQDLFVEHRAAADAPMQHVFDLFFATMTEQLALRLREQARGYGTRTY